jgi:hypothetical protein
MNDIRHDIQGGLRTALADLRSMRDEIKLKIHLGKMDVRDAWHELEPRVREVEHKLEKGGQAVGAALEQTVEELRGSLRRLRDEL